MLRVAVLAAFFPRQSAGYQAHGSIYNSRINCSRYPLARACSSDASSPEAFVQETVQNNKVVVFSKTWCGYSAMTKMTLDEMDLQYLAVELDQMDNGSEIQGALLALTKQRTVPNVFVGGKHLGGNDGRHSMLHEKHASRF